MKQDAYLRKRYGITAVQYAELLKLGGGNCWICCHPPKSRRLAVDHDHKLGRGKPESVRGLLCHKCNLGLQRFGDDPVRLRRAADYLEKKLPWLQPRTDEH